MTQLNFKPFYRNDFKYDFHFLKNNFTKLIPGGAQLKDFVDETDCKGISAKAAAIINIIGVPENFMKIIDLKPGVSENAYNHFAYLCDQEVKKMIVAGFGLEDTEDEGRSYFSLTYAFLLSQWFDESQFDRLITFSRVGFDPTHLLFTSKENNESWNIIHKNKVEQFLKAQGVNDGFGDRLVVAKKIVEGFHFYGCDNGFYSEMKFLPFLPDSTTFELVGDWLASGEKKPQLIASNLLALYMSLGQLRKLEKHIN